MSQLSIPPSTARLFWSCNTQELDSQKHKQYIVHQVLQYGDLEDWKWLQKIYNQQEIKAVFLNQPRSTYQPQTFNFVAKYLLSLPENISAEPYVKTAL